jgi:uncharacterized protein YndB with AHSA1/START domain
MTEPLRMAFEVRRAPADVFRIWTADFGRWWPAGHSVTGRADLTVTLEPRVGGRIYERTPAGAEHDWGEITLWEPPHRLGYTWHLRRDRADATDVEIRFTAAAGGTRVEIEHRGWERLGAAGPDWREANKGGWAGLLPHFQDACARL